MAFFCLLVPPVRQCSWVCSFFHLCGALSGVLCKPLNSSALFTAYLLSSFFYSATYLLKHSLLQVAKCKQQEKGRDTGGSSGASLFFWKEPSFGTGCLLTTRVGSCWPRVRPAVKQAGNQEHTIFEYGSKHTRSAMSVMYSLIQNQQQIFLQGIPFKRRDSKGTQILSLYSTAGSNSKSDLIWLVNNSNWNYLWKEHNK